MCRQSLKEWKQAIDANRKMFYFKKGEMLCYEGDEVNGIFFVYSGTVKVHKKWGTDKELIVRFAKKGDIVGHRGLGTTTTFPISATALGPVSACYIDLQFFLTTLKINQDFLFQLMIFFADELKESESRMRNLAHMPVKGRIAQALINLKEKFGCDKNGYIDITLSRQDMASYTGTTYETVFRILTEFIEDNAIEVSGRNIMLKDIRKLLSFV
ncbi:Crp/Fnr family transcriptional regulator [Chitinophagaceae bacterium LB-8]|uniref:Crp/Fnr family transcriptional regulator n=1 Tax=Paraflavisolibacter caeni TaxID=2982496 RepID=A0A9X2XY00_9BACT|nr:Crp/Fnr family transcriptional regulator [Paraflavisolibacter caeni]MCU7550767.1 Crp/Fnr family transcriptional regulator [Paraflavisolibacter caeni]